MKNTIHIQTDCRKINICKLTIIIKVINRCNQYLGVLLFGFFWEVNDRKRKCLSV